ncbi:unnamed protein product [marine sediment metagenome]|uniref:Uroporphyrinogen decarboxylase (URO-D) domain-containing protein n=3 Tax=marine sediment metagenome TaxID=412755 RepID=X1ARU8_9ZZZZ
MKTFKPNYTNILNAAKNIKPKRMPLYEHIIDITIMEKILGKKFSSLYNGDIKDRRQYFKYYINFFKKMGYDVVSFECLTTSIMPGSGALYYHKSGIIKDRKDFNSYPWDDLSQLFFEKYEDDYKLLGEEMPSGMKAIGGPGNGIFECVQDIVGLSNLCMISVDDPQLYRDLFNKIGEVFYKIWSTFLGKYSHIYAVCRFGDDLGYKSSTILNPGDIKSMIIPQYKKIVDLVHSYGKPFLLHSCGNIFSVMEDIISIAGIDAKHSNEDEIAPFSMWQKRYGDRIALFGGVDMSFLCQASEDEIKEYIRNILSYSVNYPGFAFGTGNSIPDYMPVENYIVMIETAREFRNEI